MPGLIEDYAIIGDMRTAALVRRAGSIDWMCVPRFDSPACFAALLGTPENGRWLITAKGKPRISRRYRPDTLVLETMFRTVKGEARLTDFMPVGTDHTCIVRIVTGLRGTVSMHSELVIRFGYGITVPWVTRIDEMTLTAVAGPDLLTLRTPVRLRGEDMRTKGDFTVREGQSAWFVLTYSPSNQPPPLTPSIEAVLEKTEIFWKEWAEQCKVRGKWAPEIRRSLITLKALSYRPTGGIVAAVTTSLPEQTGGSRNWDYRFCWLRDATFTLLAFMNAGYREEAVAWQSWLARAIAGSPDQLQTLYGVAGERHLTEWEVGWLPGYENSRPVRIGNAAASQLQLDIFGELSDTMAQARKGGLPPDPHREEMRKVFFGHLERIWREPDEGIWEIRGTPQHFTHSKVMAWVAFDRAWRDTRTKSAFRTRWKRIANKIHADVCRSAIDPERGCFVQAYGSKRLDASLLLLPIVGFLPAEDPHIRKTVAEIERRLVVDGLVMRYETESGIDGLPPGEGAFLACSFWLVDNYLLLGRRKDAERLYKKLVSLTNDVGLLAEEYDPRRRRMLGNFPQAFSHVALVNSGISLLQLSPKPARSPNGRKMSRSSGAGSLKKTQQ